MKLEFKSVQVESVSDKGTFEGVASPYGNIDNGNDRVVSTIGKKNDGKTVPLLWQHDRHKPIGELKLFDGKMGMQCKGQFFLDKDADGEYMIPQAAEAYLLAKKGVLKLSIGYNINDYGFKQENGRTIRELKDIDIKEVSCVTFPMNEEAVISNVKEEGGQNMKKKILSLNDRVAMEDNRRKTWQLIDALQGVVRDVLSDKESELNDKINMATQNIDEFATAYKEVVTKILQGSATEQKAIAEQFEIKSEQRSQGVNKALSKEENDKKKEQNKDKDVNLDDVLDTDKEENKTEKKSLGEHCLDEVKLPKGTVVHPLKQEDIKSDILIDVENKSSETPIEVKEKIELELKSVLDLFKKN